MYIFGSFTVLHNGIIQILTKYPNAEILLPDYEFKKYLTALEYDIRQIDFDTLSLFFTSQKRIFRIISQTDFNILIDNKEQILIISDPLTAKLVVEHQNNNKVIIETGFLRQSAEKVFTELQKSTIDGNFSKEDIKYMMQAYKHANNSGCWWRQVASILVKEGVILHRACNEMMPANDECYKSGCIRDHIKPGEKPDFCSAIHSEINIIAMAARDGITIKDSTLYVTHFPCSNCAKAIAKSGINKVVYHQGWSNFDGEEILKQNNIKLIKINV